MSTRADKFTQTNKIPDVYLDFMTDLTPHPITKDLMRVKNDASIKQSIKNLIYTNFGERMFRPTIGSGVNASLFEPNDEVLESDLDYYIRKTIGDFEKRAAVERVVINRMPDDNKVSVSILFSIINSTQLQSVNLVLRRVR